MESAGCQLPGQRALQLLTPSSTAGTHTVPSLPSRAWWPGPSSHHGCFVLPWDCKASGGLARPAAQGLPLAVEILK